MTDYTNLELVCVQRTGTAEQLERFKAGVLPEEELCTLARGELFKRFEALPRWNSRSNRRSASLHMTDVRHDADCGYRKGEHEPFDMWALRLKANGAVRFETTAASEMSASDFAKFKAICALVSRVNQELPAVTKLDNPTPFEAVPKTHWATCTMCAREELRHTALISVHWAGRTLSREYRIDTTNPEVLR